MPLSNIQVALMITVAAVCTFATRLVPVALFGGKKGVPKFVKYLGDILPTSIIGVLIIYCLADFKSGEIIVIIPKFIAVAITAGFHLWKRNTLLSIAAGTISYMLLIHFIF